MNHFTFKNMFLSTSIITASLLISGCAVPVYDSPSYTRTTIQTFPSNSTATLDSFDNGFVYPSNTIIYNRPPIYYTNPIQIAPPIIIPFRPGYHPHYRPPYRPDYRPGRPVPSRPPRPR